MQVFETMARHLMPGVQGGLQELATAWLARQGQQQPAVRHTPLGGAQQTPPGRQAVLPRPHPRLQQQQPQLPQAGLAMQEPAQPPPAVQQPPLAHHQQQLAFIRKDVEQLRAKHPGQELRIVQELMRGLTAEQQRLGAAMLSVGVASGECSAPPFPASSNGSSGSSSTAAAGVDVNGSSSSSALPSAGSGNGSSSGLGDDASSNLATTTAAGVAAGGVAGGGARGPKDGREASWLEVLGPDVTSSLGPINSEEVEAREWWCRCCGTAALRWGGVLRPAPGACRPHALQLKAHATFRLPSTRDVPTQRSRLRCRS
jgi:hypothetical protein